MVPVKSTDYILWTFEPISELIFGCSGRIYTILLKDLLHVRQLKDLLQNVCNTYVQLDIIFYCKNRVFAFTVSQCFLLAKSFTLLINCYNVTDGVLSLFSC